MKAGNNTEDMNIDNLNIKSHLNASLDFSGISVSEELIQKTLRAINEQPSTLVEKKENVLKTPRVPWNSYVRSLTGVAAALIVLIGGYSLIKNNIGMKSAKNDSNTSMDMATPEAKSHVTEEDQVLFSATDSDMGDVAMGSVTEDTTVINKDEQKMDSVTIDDIVKSSDQDMKEAPSITSEFTGASLESVEFTQIYGGTVDVIESIMVTDDAAGKSIIITDESEISKVYSLLDSYLYSAAESGLSSDIYYLIEIKEYQSDGINTITIGDTVTISSELGATDSTQAYEMINLQAFNRELKLLIESYSN
ncbi:MAG TPA: hypothetical protein GX731_03630 [Clostridiales bacterium]|nr:hypothetical protein [Clostridiales bacterium]